MQGVMGAHVGLPVALGGLIALSGNCSQRLKCEVPCAVLFFKIMVLIYACPLFISLMALNGAVH